MTSAGGDAVKMRIGGMDCSACAIKVENALKRLPGVSDISVNYTTETLSLRLDSDRMARETIEQKIRTLGYVPTAFAGMARPSEQGTESPREAGDLTWWKARKGRMVLALGALLVAAFAASMLKPELGHWAYGVAAALG